MYCYGSVTRLFPVRLKNFVLKIPEKMNEDFAGKIIDNSRAPINFTEPAARSFCFSPNAVFAPPPLPFHTGKPSASIGAIRNKWHFGAVFGEECVLFIRWGGSLAMRPLFMVLRPSPAPFPGPRRRFHIHRSDAKYLITRNLNKCQTAAPTVPCRPPCSRRRCIRNKRRHPEWSGPNGQFCAAENNWARSTF